MSVLVSAKIPRYFHGMLTDSNTHAYVTTTGYSLPVCIVGDIIYTVMTESNWNTCLELSLYVFLGYVSEMGIRADACTVLTESDPDYQVVLALIDL